MQQGQLLSIRIVVKVSHQSVSKSSRRPIHPAGNASSCSISAFNLFRLFMVEDSNRLFLLGMFKIHFSCLLSLCVFQIQFFSGVNIFAIGLSTLHKIIRDFNYFPPAAFHLVSYFLFQRGLAHFLTYIESAYFLGRQPKFSVGR